MRSPTQSTFNSKVAGWVSWNLIKKWCTGFRTDTYIDKMPWRRRNQIVTSCKQTKRWDDVVKNALLDQRRLEDAVFIVKEHRFNRTCKKMLNILETLTLPNTCKIFSVWPVTNSNGVLEMKNFFYTVRSNRPENICPNCRSKNFFPHVFLCERSEQIPYEFEKQRAICASVGDVLE